MTGSGALVTPLCSIAAVSAGGGVIFNAAATPVAVVYLYLRRRRAIHFLIRAPNAVAARKDNRRIGGQVALGVPRGDDDRDGLADFRFGKAVAVVIHRRSERYLRRRRMGVLQADEIELFTPRQRANTAIAQINRLDVAVFRTPAQIGGAVLVVFTIQRPALLRIHGAAGPGVVQRLQIGKCRYVSRATDVVRHFKIDDSPGFVVFRIVAVGKAAGDFSR